MMNQEKQARVAAAERLYATFLRARLEPQHDGQFVAIEPDSGEYYLGKTLSEAIQASRRIYPDRLPYAMRIGAQPAIHIGVWP